MSSHDQHNHDQTTSHEKHHITPLSTYLKVATALFALTFLTIIAHIFKTHYLAAAPFIAFTIASVKAFLVMAWFMHLKYEPQTNRLIFACGFLGLAVLFGVCAMDIFTRIYQGSVL